MANRSHERGPGLIDEADDDGGVRDAFDRILPHLALFVARVRQCADTYKILMCRMQCDSVQTG